MTSFGLVDTKSIKENDYGFSFLFLFLLPLIERNTTYAGPWNRKSDRSSEIR